MTECPLCNGKLNHKKQKIDYEYKNYKINLEQEGLYCEECKEGFLSPNDIKQNDKRLVDFRREIDHLLKTDELKRIRKKLHLTQQEAGVIFGGGVRAFHKYEMGLNNQSRSLDILLRLVDKDKISIEDIKEVI